MLHLSKLAFPQGHGIASHPRLLPLWLPAALALLALATAAVSAHISVSESPFSGSASRAVQVESFVMRFVNDWSEHRDPLVTLDGGRQAKSSNVYGVEYEGVRYFYQLTHQDSFDPLRTGALRDYRTVAVVDKGTGWEVLIYTAR